MSVRTAVEVGRKFAAQQEAVRLLSAALVATYAVCMLTPAHADIVTTLFLAYSGSVTLLVTGHAAANTMSKRRTTPLTPKKKTVREARSQTTTEVTNA